MKAKRFIFTICFIGLIIAVSAQPGRRGQIKETTTINGAIDEWVYNDDFEYDGLYLRVENSKILVKFPPHLAQQARALGNRISVNGVLGYNREGIQELKMISMSGNGQVVYDQKPTPDYNYTQEPFINGSGRVAQIQINKRGDVVGYIIDNNIVLRIPPHIARQLSQLVQVGSVIEYSGIEKALKKGHVRAFNYKIIRCQTILINGTQYVVR